MTHCYEIDIIVDRFWAIIIQEYDIINNVTDEQFNDITDYDSDSNTDYDEDDLF